VSSQVSNPAPSSRRTMVREDLAAPDQRSCATCTGLGESSRQRLSRPGSSPALPSWPCRFDPGHPLQEVHIAIKGILNAAVKTDSRISCPGRVSLSAPSAAYSSQRPFRGALRASYRDRVSRSRPVTPGGRSPRRLTGAGDCAGPGPDGRCRSGGVFRTKAAAEEAEPGFTRRWPVACGARRPQGTRPHWRSTPTRG
jgi:hypothetical protein